ncbi:hypothetical protein [Flavobacterium sp. SM2513]|uniref:hypothetical protein n=1 Tax=Flavobacterium sp. SM2513 TaxID=3424766 RepID=UPI003D7FF1A0
MDTENFRKDIALVDALEEVGNLAFRLHTDVSDTRILAGHESLVTGMFYYVIVKEAFSRGAASTRAIYEDLQVRFSRGPYNIRIKKD